MIDRGEDVYTPRRKRSFLPRTLCDDEDLSLGDDRSYSNISGRRYNIVTKMSVCPNCKKTREDLSRISSTARRPLKNQQGPALLRSSMRQSSERSSTTGSVVGSTKKFKIFGRTSGFWKIFFHATL
jgi:hypothetical protein